MLNIAEGSTSQSNPEQARFLSFAIRSHIEVVACIKLILNRGYMNKEEDLYRKFDVLGAKLFAKLHAFRKAVS